MHRPGLSVLPALLLLQRLERCARAFKVGPRSGLRGCDAFPEPPQKRCPA